MDIERFKSSPSGRVVPIAGHDVRTDTHWSHWAYIAKPLPPTIELLPQTQVALSEADREIGALNAFLRLIPSPHLLIRPSLSREAVSTSALEGTFASLEDVLEADYTDESKATAPVREVRNYLRAADTSLEMIKIRPVCVSVISELQAILVKGTRGETFDAGELRKRQVFIGDHGRPVEESRFVPCPPGEELINGVSDWEKWINSDDPIPLLVKVALGHYQFETLHPFSDGNGRLGRLIITLQLMDNKVLDYPILNMASWLEPRRQQYIDLLLQVSSTGDFDSWIRFFVTGVKEQASKTSAAIKDLLAAQREIDDQLNSSGDKSVATKIARDLIGFPIFDVRSVATRYEVSVQTANSAVSKLVAMGILRQLGDRAYARLFICDRIFTIVSKL